MVLVISDWVWSFGSHIDGMPFISKEQKKSDAEKKEKEIRRRGAMNVESEGKIITEVDGVWVFIKIKET